MLVLGYKTRKILTCMNSNAQLILTLLGVSLGICLGCSLWESKLDAKWKMIIGFPGEILMNIFKMIVLPLITVTLIYGVGKMDRKQLGLIGGFAMLSFAVTTLFVVAIGVMAVKFAHPGDPEAKLGSLSTGSTPMIVGHAETIDTFLDLLRNAFTDNIFESTMKVTRTKLLETDLGTDPITGEKIVSQKRIIQKERGSNILGLVIFSIWFGGILSFLGKENSKPLLDLLSVMNMVVIRMVRMAIWYTPFALIFLVAQKILEIKEPGKVLGTLGWFLLLSMSCQFVVFIMQNVLYTCLTLRDPRKMIKAQVKMMVMAFGTGSSLATLPTTMECCEEGMGVNRSISRLVLPVGATINLHGASTSIAISAIFIAQLNGTELGTTDYLIVWITSSLAAIGAAGVPSGSLFTMAVVLSAIRQPITDISIILTIDWILSPFRTVINCYGNAVIACILDHYFHNNQEVVSKMIEVQEESASPLPADYVEVTVSGSKEANRVPTPKVPAEPTA